MPTPKAQERYNNGNTTNKLLYMFPALKQRLSGMQNPTVTTVVLNNLGFLKNPAAISLIVGKRFNGQPDTVYVETPDYLQGVQVIPRMGGMHVSPNDYSEQEANEYNILKRRFNQALSVSKKENGGEMITKHQQGGQAPQQNDLQQQIVQLVQAAANGDQQATQQIEQILQAALQGDQQAIQIAQMIQQVVEAMKQQKVKAQYGAKLDYIKRLKGVCPEGTEKIYLKSGGCMCLKVTKAQEGTKTEKNTITLWKRNRKVEKKACGSKMKK